VAISVIASVLGSFVILRHHENIKRLLNGTENKFAKKKPAQP
jgi:glycerol-3-phosphate acyltransferase PlsY